MRGSQRDMGIPVWRGGERSASLGVVGARKACEQCVEVFTAWRTPPLESPCNGLKQRQPHALQEVHGQVASQANSKGQRRWGPSPCTLFPVFESCCVPGADPPIIVPAQGRNIGQGQIASDKSNHTEALLCKIVCWERGSILVDGNERVNEPQGRNNVNFGCSGRPTGPSSPLPSPPRRPCVLHAAPEGAALCGSVHYMWSPAQQHPPPAPPSSIPFTLGPPQAPRPPAPAPRTRPLTQGPTEGTTSF